MSDYSKIPDWQLSLINEKPAFGFNLSAKEEAALASRPAPALSPFFQSMKESDPERFKMKYVKGSSLEEFPNYRQNYTIRVLFLLAIKKRLLPDFGSTPDEKDYVWKKRYYHWAKWTVNGVGIGSLAMFNLAYMLPRYSVYGLGLTLLGNVSIAGTFYMLGHGLLEPLSINAMVSHHKLADKFKDVLLELQRNNKLVYHYEPSTAIYPPNIYKAEEDEYDQKLKIHRFANQDEGTILGDVKARHILYKSTKQY